MSRDEAIEAKEKEIREAEKLLMKLYDETIERSPAVIAPMRQAAENPSEIGPDLNDVDAFNDTFDARHKAQERVDRLYRELRGMEVQHRRSA
ncbi:MAG: hypothetical protein ABI821_17400 [Pseudomonadota bacterium]